MVICSLFNFYISLMVIVPLAALSKPSKTRKTEIEKQIVKVLQQASYHRKKAGKQKTEIMKYSALTPYLLARLTKTLILASGCFKNLLFTSSCLLFFFTKSIFIKQLTYLCETLSFHLNFCMNHMIHLKKKLFYMEIITFSEN